MLYNGGRYCIQKWKQLSLKYQTGRALSVDRLANPFLEAGWVGRGQEIFFDKLSLQADELQIDQQHEDMEGKWKYYPIPPSLDST